MFRRGFASLLFTLASARLHLDSHARHQRGSDEKAQMTVHLIKLCVGVDTVKELKYRNPKNLAQAMAAQNDKRKLVHLLPSEKAVSKWVE